MVGRHLPAKTGKDLWKKKKLICVLAALCLGSNWVLGLRQDGTVAAAAADGRTPDVSGWTDIADIGNGGTYCVGVRKDGTLAFAGDFNFGDDGPGNG